MSTFANTIHAETTTLGKVTRLRVPNTQRKKKQLRVRWEPKANATAYHLRVTNEATDTQRVIRVNKSTARQKKIKSLQPGMDYYKIEIRALSDSVKVRWSRPLIVTTKLP